MYKILIVDDVIHERDVISFLINKNNFPLEIVYASNGKEALTVLANKNIDILFTDIQMPFINGIDLANEVRSLYPNMEIIFFSGYDDFEYIKTALSLRAVNYILKPVNQEEFKKTISSVIEILNNKKLIKESENKKIDFIKNNILYQIINGTSFGLIKDNYPTFNFDYINSYSRLFLLQFDTDFFGSKNQYGDLDLFQDKVSELFPYSVTLINLNPCQSVILFSDECSFDIHYNLASELHKVIYDLINKHCYISISDIFKDPNDLYKAYIKAELLLQKRFFYDNQFIYFNVDNGIQLPSSSEKDEPILKNIEKYLNLKDVQSIEKNITLLLNRYDGVEIASPTFIKFSCANIIKVLLQNNDTDIYEITEKIFSCVHFYQIKEIVLDTLNFTINSFGNDASTTKHAITLVKKYINEHYSEDLSLDILANKVFLTPRYLSAIFIEETGFGLNKYIKNIRMEHARNLIENSNMKINEICKAVGYSNVSYFCKSFQTEFGITPEKHRNKIK
jgi:two-component system, response regulator YesN